MGPKPRSLLKRFNRSLTNAHHLAYLAFGEGPILLLPDVQRLLVRIGCVQGAYHLAEFVFDGGGGG